MKKLNNNLNIELIKKSKEFIFDTTESIANWKNIIIWPTNSSYINGTIFYFDELPFGILPHNHYLNTETTNISNY